MTLLIFFAVLVLLILVHELGHFIVAKRASIRVDEFGIGFPPKITGKKYGETEYTINWLPIGGFVRIWGEDPTEEHFEGPGSERSFVRKPRAVQAAVLVAGVAMNVVLAFVLYTAAYMIGMPTAIDETEGAAVTEEAHIYIGSVFPDAPAADALRPNDKLLAVQTDVTGLNSAAIRMPSRVAEFVSQHENETMTFTVLRRDEEVVATLTPKRGVLPEEPERVAAGFSMSLIVLEQLPLHAAVVAGAKRTYTSLVEIAQGLGGLVRQTVQGTADYSQIAGPVGIVGMVGDAAAMGFTWLLTFTALISLNLAIINLLPVPALDGGRLLFVLIEAVTRRTIRPVVARTVNQVGFIALLALMALITIQDVMRILG